MNTGRWMEPRYVDRSIFEKDFASIHLDALEVYCPGCKAIVRLARQSSHTSKIGGWCAKCSRAVAP